MFIERSKIQDIEVCSLAGILPEFTPFFITVTKQIAINSIYRLQMDAQHVEQLLTEHTVLLFKTCIVKVHDALKENEQKAIIEAHDYIQLCDAYNDAVLQLLNAANATNFDSEVLSIRAKLKDKVRLYNSFVIIDPTTTTDIVKQTDDESQAMYPYLLIHRVAVLRALNMAIRGNIYELMYRETAVAFIELLLGRKDSQIEGILDTLPKLPSF